MKTFMRFLCAAMLLVSFAACTGDEIDNPGEGDSNNYSTLLVGNWRVDQWSVNNEEMDIPNMQISFYENSSGMMSYGFNPVPHNDFTWAINDSNITINTDNNQFTFTIDNLTATECEFHGSYLEMDGLEMSGYIHFHMTKINDDDNPDPNVLGISTPEHLDASSNSLTVKAHVTGSIYLYQFPNYTCGVVWCLASEGTPTMLNNVITCTPDTYGYFEAIISDLNASTSYTIVAWLKPTPESTPILGNPSTYTTYPSGDWVDLGLPSGLLWASCNLGATSPDGYGEYYAWGELQPKSNYKWENYNYGNAYNQLTKYCNDSSYGFNGYTDNLTTLEPTDDAVINNLGNGARIPTKAEWEEMVSNTTHIWTTKNGIEGWRYTAPNGNSIFMPAAGSKTSGVFYVGIMGHYWSSTLVTNGTFGPDCAWQLGYDITQPDANLHHMSPSSRCIGFSVRAVKSAN